MLPWQHKPGYELDFALLLAKQMMMMFLSSPSSVNQWLQISDLWEKAEAKITAAFHLTPSLGALLAQ